MGMLAAAMGLPQGKEGMQQLTKLMKQGKIGMEELFKFLDMAAGRARSTGAYDLAINSKQAYETRMTNSYKLFSDAFITFFDDKIKGTFSGISESLDNLTNELKKAAELQKATGIVGDTKTRMDYILMIFSKAGDGLMLGVESLYEFAKAVNIIPKSHTMQTSLADREAENKFLSKHPDWSASQIAGWRGKGRPGIDEDMYNTLKGLGASDNEAQRYLDMYRERNPIPGTERINPAIPKTGILGLLSGAVNSMVSSNPAYMPPRYSGGMPMSNPNNYQTIPNITVMINGVQVDPGSIEAQIANSFGNLYKKL